MEPQWSQEPDDPAAFTARFHRFYTRFAGLYDLLVKLIPSWRRWNAHVLPQVRGSRVLEVSFGTGDLMTRFSPDLTVVGVDLSAALARVARRNLQASHIAANLALADVTALPFPDSAFDTVVNTMALSGYPDAHAAVSEMMRVLRSDGRLVCIDFTNPANRNLIGTCIARFWDWSGDVIRDMPRLFDELGLTYTDEEIGAWGSVHLFVVRRRSL
jgi:ubiquinone/menaquinone biosynthesis C-methylase UbiE